MKELVIKPSRVLLGVCMRGEGSSITHLHNSMTMNILAIKTASIYIVLYSCLPYSHSYDHPLSFDCELQKVREMSVRVCTSVLSPGDLDLPGGT